MNKEIREQLKDYELTEEIMNERFKYKDFKTDIGTGSRLWYKTLYSARDRVSPDKYPLHELVDWIKTLLGTGANVHHPILYHINKEKAVEVVNEIIEIIKEKEEKSKICKEPEYDMYDMVESSKDWPIIDEMKKQEEESMKKQEAILKLADGREIKVEISEEELKKLQVKKNPYDQVKKNERIYFINSCGVIEWTPEDCEELGIAAGLKGNINYYNDKTAAENDARADLLMRKLRKFAIESNLEHEKQNNNSYQIVYDKNTKIMASYTRCISLVDFNVILFNTSDDCKEAIETFHDELIWYFTEYLKIYE